MQSGLDRLYEDLGLLLGGMLYLLDTWELCGDAKVLI